MKRKTYIKKLYALMQEMNKENIKVYGEPAYKIGRILYGIQKVGFKCKDEPKVKSYAEAWEILKPLRSRYGM